MDKKKLLYGLVGLLLGVAGGYWGTDTLNRKYADAANDKNASSLAADHPTLGEGAALSSASADGPQEDVTVVLQQARNEPANFSAQMKAGGLFTQIKRHEQALEFYQRAQQLKPKEIDALTALGNTLFDLQRYQEAERWYLEALKLKPQDANLHTDLGLSYFLREPKDLDKAIAAYRAALGYDPRHEQALQNVITALIAKGDKAAARGYLPQLEQVNPNNQALAQLRAQLTQN